MWPYRHEPIVSRQPVPKLPRWLCEGRVLDELQLLLPARKVPLRLLRWLWLQNRLLPERVLRWMHHHGVYKHRVLILHVVR